MNKSEAIARIAKMPGSGEIVPRSIHFANVNSSKNVWWLEIPVAELSKSGNSIIKLLLYDHKSDRLYILNIPTAYFRDNRMRLATRNEKDCISLELSAEHTKMFRDVRSGGDSVDFSRFLNDTI